MRGSRRTGDVIPFERSPEKRALNRAPRLMRDHLARHNYQGYLTTLIEYLTLEKESNPEFKKGEVIRLLSARLLEYSRELLQSRSELMRTLGVTFRHMSERGDLSPAMLIKELEQLRTYKL